MVFSQAIKESSKNHMSNAFLDIWQRGASFPKGVGGRYTADRWYAGDLLAVEKYQLTETEQELIGESARTNAMKIAVIEPANTEDTLRMRIDDVRKLANKKCIIEFYAWASGASGDAYLNKLKIKQNFGSGGSAETSQDLLSYPAGGFPNTPTKYLLSFDMPSIVGKTIGTDSYIEVEFLLGIRTVLDEYSFTGFKLYEGEKATPARKSFEEELCDCYYYYQHINSYSLGENGVANPSYRPDFIWQCLHYFKEMRVMPTVSYIAGTTFGCSVIISDITQEAHTVQLQVVGNPYGMYILGYEFMMDAEL